MILHLTDELLTANDAYLWLRDKGYGQDFAGRAVAEAEETGHFDGPDLEVQYDGQGFELIVRSI